MPWAGSVRSGLWGEGHSMIAEVCTGSCETLPPPKLGLVCGVAQRLGRRLGRRRSWRCRGPQLGPTPCEIAACRDNPAWGHGRAWQPCICCCRASWRAWKRIDHRGHRGRGGLYCGTVGVGLALALA